MAYEATDLLESNQTRQANLDYTSICERYHTQIFHQCLHITNDYESAQDYTHDILLKLFEKLRTFRGRSQISTWIYRITINYCYDQLRLARRMPLERLPPGKEWMVAEELQEVFDDSAAKQAWQTLSIETQQLLRLKYEQGTSIMMLAEEFHCSVSAIKMRLLRGRHQFRLAYQAVHNAQGCCIARR